MVSDLVNAQVDPETVARIRACRLVPIGKTGGGVRPIAVGEAIARIACAVVLARHLAILLKHFGELQLALAPGGVESAAHFFRAERASGATVITLDAKNAFNAVSRRAIRDTLGAMPALAGMWPLFGLLYAGRSALHLPNGSTIYSEEGVRQGDVFGPALFALVVQPILERCSATHPTVKLKAFLDDISLSSQDLPALAQAFAWLVPELAAIGLQLNPGKCFVLGPTPAISDDLAAALGIASASTWDKAPGAIRLLGALLGPDDVVRPALVMLAMKQCELLPRLASLTPDEAYALLRFCAVPRFTFFARVHPPEICGEACSVFDDAIMRELARIAEVAPSALAPGTPHAELAGLPMPLGGLGIRSISSIAPQAYLASSRPEGDSQEVLTMAIDAATAARLAQGELGGLLAANRPAATRLIFAQPEEDTPTWGKGLFAVALQMRLGLTHRATCMPAGTTALLCDCGLSLKTHEWADHVCGCTKRQGYNASARAADVNALVASFVAVRAPQLGPVKQPPVGRGLLADLAVTLPAGRLVVDWVVYSPLARSRPSEAKSEARKAKHYEGCDAVVGCAASCRGNLSRATLTVVRSLEAACNAPKNALANALIRCIVASTASVINDARLRTGFGLAGAPFVLAPPRPTLPLSALAPLSPDDELAPSAAAPDIACTDDDEPCLNTSPLGPSALPSSVSSPQKTTIGSEQDDGKVLKDEGRDDGELTNVDNSFSLFHSPPVSSPHVSTDTVFPKNTQDKEGNAQRVSLSRCDPAVE
jgi:hypothetical protein